MTVEYRVRPITRYIITRYEATEQSRTSTQHGQFEDGATAYHVAYALCRAEHDRSGEPEGSMNFVYPAIPAGVDVPPLGGGGQ